MEFSVEMTFFTLRSSSFSLLRLCLHKSLNTRLQSVTPIVLEVLVVAKKKSKQSKKVSIKGVPRNVIVGGIVVVLVVVLYYLFASQNGAFVGLGV